MQSFMRTNRRAITNFSGTFRGDAEILRLRKVVRNVPLEERSLITVSLCRKLAAARSYSESEFDSWVDYTQASYDALS